MMPPLPPDAVLLPWSVLRASLGAPAASAALLHFCVAMVCAWAGCRRSTHQGDRRFWSTATLLLAALAVNCLVHADRALVLWMREAANAGDWYALRRPLQGATLALLVATVWLVVPHLVRSGRPDSSDHLRPAMAGLGMLVALLVLRLVSLHHTDFVLDLRLVGLSLGRWLETLAFGLVMFPALGALMGPAGRPFRKRPHV